jgi:hypothetical protein
MIEGERNDQGAFVKLINVNGSMEEQVATAADFNSTTPNKLHPDDREAFIFDDKNKRLRICTSAIIRRLFGNKDFKAAFNPSEGGGFIQDFPTSRELKMHLKALVWDARVFRHPH